MPREGLSTTGGLIMPQRNPVFGDRGGYQLGTAMALPFLGVSALISLRKRGCHVSLEPSFGSLHSGDGHVGSSQRHLHNNGILERSCVR